MESKKSSIILEIEHLKDNKTRCHVDCQFCIIKGDDVACKIFTDMGILYRSEWCILAEKEEE